MACRYTQSFYKDALSLVTLNVEHQSVVTSGIYERYFIQEHQLFHHILDSNTGYPVDNDIASVTIISDHGIDGEVWSTICSFGQSQQNIELLNLIDGVEGIIVTRDGNVLMTSKCKGIYNFKNTHKEYFIFKYKCEKSQCIRRNCYE